jgi:hypothetical protein
MSKASYKLNRRDEFNEQNEGEALNLVYIILAIIIVIVLLLCLL